MFVLDYKPQVRGLTVPHGTESILSGLFTATITFKTFLKMQSDSIVFWTVFRRHCMKIQLYSLFWEPLIEIAFVFLDEPFSFVLSKLVVSVNIHLIFTK